MLKLLSVCAGGALGAGTRYLITLWVARSWGAQIPIATFLVNVLGAFLLAFLLESFLLLKTTAPALRLAITMGFLGSFTTYSTFNQEVLSFWRSAEWFWGSLYLGGTLIAALSCGLLGRLTAFVLFR